MAFFRGNLKAQLTPIFSQDLVTPGIFYFALLEPQKSGDIQSWWIVLRCPEEVLPQPFRDSKEASSRAFPFFVPGGARFIWLERDALYLLHPSQKIAFAHTTLHGEFSDFYDLATGAAKSDPLKYFERDIAEASNRVLKHRARLVNGSHVSHSRQVSPTQRPSGQSLFFSEAEPSDNEETSVYQATPPRKRRRIQQDKQVANVTASSRLGSSSQGTAPATSEPILSNPPVPTSAAASQRVSLKAAPRRPNFTRSTPVEPSVVIKSEAEAYQVNFGQIINLNDRVNVILGPGHRPFPTDRKALEKSAVLFTLIQQDPKHGSYIMHPELTNAWQPDVLAMLEFLQSGEYRPKRVSRPDQQTYGPSALEGKSHQYEYSEELVRAGRLYNLAKIFNITPFAEHILDKLNTTQYLAYSRMAIMSCACVVFSEPGPHTQNSRDAMETWLIRAIAGSFKQIMQSNEERAMFWEMEQKTAKRKLLRDIFALCAENYHAISGIPINID